MNVLKSWSEKKLWMQMANKALPDDWRTRSQAITLSVACFLTGQNVWGWADVQKALATIHVERGGSL